MQKPRSLHICSQNDMTGGRGDREVPDSIISVIATRPSPLSPLFQLGTSPNSSRRGAIGVVLVKEEANKVALEGTRSQQADKRSDHAKFSRFTCAAGKP
jgi:hypothetical protein